MRPMYRSSYVKEAYGRDHREGTSFPAQETERVREGFLEKVSAFGLGLK